MECKGKKDNLIRLFISKSVQLKTVNKFSKSEQNDSCVVEEQDPMIYIYIYSYIADSSIRKSDDEFSLVLVYSGSSNFQHS